MNSMRKKTIIRSGRKIVLYEFIPDLYEKLAWANGVLKQLRKGIHTWVSKKTFDEMNVSIWIYEDDKANAFCSYIDGENYISLSIGLIMDFWNEANEFVDQEDFSLVFKLNEKNKAHYIDALFFYMLNNTIAHEFGHIAHGHLKKGDCENYIDEMLRITDEDGNNSKNWITQLKEYDADIFAATLQSNLFLQNWDDNLKVNLANFDMMFLANYLCFRVFAEKFGRDFKDYAAKNTDEFDHPYPGIRMYYTIIVYAYWLGEVHGYTEDVFSILSSGYHAIIAYEKQVLNKENIKDSYYSVAFTEKGSQHIMNLNNQWEELVDEYNEYSFIPIQKLGDIDIMPFSVDENGDFFSK